MKPKQLKGKKEFMTSPEHGIVNVYSEQNIKLAVKGLKEECRKEFGIFPLMENKINKWFYS